MKTTTIHLLHICKSHLFFTETMHITFIHLSCHKENHVHSYESVQIQQKVHSFMFTDTTKITTDHVYIGLYLASFLTRF